MEEETLTACAAQALLEYRRAFIAWAIAAYAHDIEPLEAASRREALDRTRESARAHRDDAHIRLLSALFPESVPKEDGGG
jgi:hypothetical protein